MATRCCSPPESFNPHSRGGSDFRHPRRGITDTRFNPHSRGGSDGRDSGKENQECSFNPHCPAGGVTDFQSCTELKEVCFNPHSRGGSDSIFIISKLNTLLFQSALPRGE